MSREATPIINKLTPIELYPKQRQFNSPNSKGNELPSNHFINESQSVQIQRQGSVIPWNKRGLRFWEPKYETITGTEEYRQYFQSRDSEGRVVSFAKLSEHLDDESFENFLSNFGEHRNGHLNMLESPYQLSEYIHDLTLLTSGLKQSGRDFSKIMNEELRLDITKLLGELEFYIVYPTNFYKRNDESTKTNIINVMILFPLLKKLLPEIQIINHCELQTKKYLSENISFPKIEMKDIKKCFEEFKSTFINQNRTDFGPNYPSVDFENANSDFDMMQEYLRSVDFYSYLDSFENSKDIESILEYFMTNIINQKNRDMKIE